MCVIYIILSLKTSVVCMESVLFFTLCNALGFFPYCPLISKNAELLTAFRIDCSGIVILFSVHVIIFNN